MQTFHIIEAKYLGYTDTKGSRIRLRSERFQQTIIVSKNEYDTGADWLRKNGFNVIGCGYTKDNVIIVTDTFKPLKSKK